jgi:hypothetical protein
MRCVLTEAPIGTRTPKTTKHHQFHTRPDQRQHTMPTVSAPLITQGPKS